MKQCRVCSAASQLARERNQWHQKRRTLLQPDARLRALPAPRDQAAIPLIVSAPLRKSLCGGIESLSGESIRLLRRSAKFHCGRSRGRMLHRPVTFTPEEHRCLIGVVSATSELDVRRGRRTAGRVGLHMVKLEKASFRTAAA